MKAMKASVSLTREQVAEIVDTRFSRFFRLTAQVYYA